MNFLFISYDALITDIAWKVAQEGHQVKYFIQDEESKDIGDGLVAKADDWRREVDWADTIVFDDVLGHGRMAEELRKKGKHVLGGTAYTDQLEDDQAYVFSRKAWLLQLESSFISWPEEKIPS